MSYNRWITYSDELYHHGVKGMRWGVRRYQPYADGSYGSTGKRIQKAEAISNKGTARAYGRSMNKLARIAGESKSRQAGYAEKFNSIVDKRNNALERGKSKKAAKLESKAWKTRAKVEMEGANAKAAANKWAKIGADAAEKGYSVKLSKEYRYSARSRRDTMIAQSLLGLYGNVAVTTVNTKLDKEYRSKHGTDYSPYAYDTIRAKVKKPKE